MAERNSRRRHGKFRYYSMSAAVMPAKEGGKSKQIQASKQAAKGGAGGKAKKKKWNKGKAKEKLNNLVLFDKPTYEKLYKEVPSWRLITPTIVSERLRVSISLARRAVRELVTKGLIREVVNHNAQLIYTRASKE